MLQESSRLFVTTGNLTAKFQTFNFFAWTLNLIRGRKFFKLFFFKETITVAVVFLFFNQRPRRVKRLLRTFRLTCLLNNLENNWRDGLLYLERDNLTLRSNFLVVILFILRSTKSYNILELQLSHQIQKLLSKPRFSRYFIRASTEHLIEFLLLHNLRF